MSQAPIADHDASARPSRPWSRALVAAVVVLTAVAAGAQLFFTFLFNAPQNVISTQFQAQTNWWMLPLLNQNWQLFAPNPISENLEVDARVSSGQSGRLSSWLDLTSIDLANTVGNPVPSHLTMNAMRNAWREYEDTHDSSERPTSSLAVTAEQYLEAYALTYLRSREPGPIDSVQVRFIVTLIPGPGRTAAQTAPQTQELPWWTVAGAA